MPSVILRCLNPSCQAKLKVSREQTGKRYRCPKCHSVGPLPNVDQPGDASGAHALAVDSAGARDASPEDRLASVAEQLAWEPGKVLLDDFRVEQHLGRGGMGDVYLVRSQSIGQQYAVKRILPQLVKNWKHRRAFLNELRNWIDLPEHPNLTACRFFRTVENQTLVFAEYVPGGSLEQWIQQERLQALDQALDVAIQFAWGLAVAHDRGLVHQDVKPLNVLMTEEGIPKVTDFGLAKARGVVEAIQARPAADPTSRLSEETIHGALVTGATGTPAYCSREQAEGRRLSHKTDVWSWGLSVLAMFVGERTW